MPRVKFVNLFLFSQAERRALKVPLNSQRLIIQGGNGFGKSAIIKSLYESLGTTPQKIDSRWKSANVSSCLQFEYEGKLFAAVKTLGVYSMFDDRHRILFSGQRIVKDWGPKLAAFFNFKLEMTDRDGEIISPPPAYMVAPFYIDQDMGWAKTWNSFEDFYLNDTPRTLAEYHSGIKPDEYYSAKANYAKERLTLNGLEAVVRTLRETISQIQQIDEGPSPTYDLSEFESEIADLVAESTSLFREQSHYRGIISDLHEEVHLLGAEMHLIQQALKEMRGDFVLAAGLPAEVECPTCGQGYQNALADRFALIADEGVLIDALGRANAKLGQTREKERRERAKLGEIEGSLERIRRILDIRRASMSFGDVIVAAGKTEAAKMLRDSLSKKLLETDKSRADVEENKATMDGFADPARTAKILKFFRSRLAAYSASLDVKIDDPSKQAITTIKVARGSEGPRALLAYYYAFIHTNEEFANATTFPLVIDAPNQQGQDAVHLPQMLRFIFEHAPSGAQVIVATEDVGAHRPAGAEVSVYGERQRQVLREAEYGEVLRLFEPYTQAILASARNGQDRP